MCRALADLRGQLRRSRRMKEPKPSQWRRIILPSAVLPVSHDINYYINLYFQHVWRRGLQYRVHRCRCLRHHPYGSWTGQEGRVRYILVAAVADGPMMIMICNRLPRSQGAYQVNFRRDNSGVGTNFLETSAWFLYLTCSTYSKVLVFSLDLFHK